MGAALGRSGWVVGVFRAGIRQSGAGGVGLPVIPSPREGGMKCCDKTVGRGQSKWAISPRGGIMTCATRADRVPEGASGDTVGSLQRAYGVVT
jgi:hypothetical protein